MTAEMRSQEPTRELEGQGPSRRGIGSVEVAVEILETLSSATEPLMLKQIAAGAGMPPAKVHRYLVTFLKTGLAAKEEQSGRYILGPLATRLGIRAFSRHDALARASSTLAELRDAIHETCFLSCWTDRGPIIFRWENCLRPVTVIVKVGSLMPLLTSATGRVFLSYMPSIFLVPLLEKESGIADLDHADVRGIIETTRRRGVGEVHGEFQSDIEALSAPIRNPLGEMVGSVTALGRKGQFDASVDGEIETKLKEFSQNCAS